MKPGPYGPFPYSPIIRRPRLDWPGGARVALWVVPNIEFFSLETRPGGLGPGKIPDIPIWAMRDYGNRVGVFRLMDDAVEEHQHRHVGQPATRRVEAQRHGHGHPAHRADLQVEHGDVERPDAPRRHQRRHGPPNTRRTTSPDHRWRP